MTISYIKSPLAYIVGVVDLETYNMCIQTHSHESQVGAIYDHTSSFLHLDSNKVLLFSNPDNWAYNGVGYVHRQLLSAYYLPTNNLQTSGIWDYFGGHACL